MANKDFMDPELTEEEKEDMIIKNEEDYLEGLLAAADDAANDIKKIDIIRNERRYFSFSIHSLTDEMLRDIRKKYTKYTKNRRQGIRVADELDMPKYRASLIYNSTTEEDKAKLWDNPAVKKGLEAERQDLVRAVARKDPALGQPLPLGDGGHQGLGADLRIEVEQGNLLLDGLLHAGRRGKGVFVGVELDAGTLGLVARRIGLYGLDFLA